jgi:hypothetical protein
MGIVLGAISILFALDASGRIKTIELVLLGIGTILLAIIGPSIHRRLASSVDVHRGGMRVGRPGRLRFVRWTDIVNVIADYRITRIGTNDVPTHQLTLVLAHDDRVVLRGTSCADPTSMMRTVEEVSRATLQPQIARELADGKAISVGSCHLVANGWMIHNTLLPWNALQRVAHHGNRVVVDVLPIGAVELGKYSELPAAWALLNLAVDKARGGGTTATMFHDVPVEWT